MQQGVMSMSNAAVQIRTLAAKELIDARRTHLLVLIAVFMLSAGSVALVVAALALKAEVETYHASREVLLSLGKPVDALAPPAFHPLKLFRGFIEHIEILGAILGIVLGYRAAAAERGKNTLMLLLTRPMTRVSFLTGKILGNLTVIVGVLILVFGGGIAGIAVLGGVRIGADSLARIAVTVVAASLYVSFFFFLGFGLALSIKRPAHALLMAFSIWLIFVLIAPQIGDTLDPDNQVAGGTFRTLGVSRPLEKEILKSFATYEAIRDGIEQSSPAKHFERLSFAVLGIKETYTGLPLTDIIKDRFSDVLWLVGLFASAVAVLFLRPLNMTKLAGE
jgi:ABC-type transport system involved in multi-copper enzyme maturation permease subunit